MDVLNGYCVYYTDNINNRVSTKLIIYCNRLYGWHIVDSVWTSLRPAIISYCVCDTMILTTEYAGFTMFIVWITYCIDDYKILSSVCHHWHSVWYIHKNSQRLSAAVIIQICAKYFIIKCIHILVICFVTGIILTCTVMPRKSVLYCRLYATV